MLKNTKLSATKAVPKAIKLKEELAHNPSIEFHVNFI